ncbi:acyl-CoA dehydrogenase family protein [Streptomyces sp. NPDC052396]|uniref:acyl-CoA dehydrogenase family protein n=1 Tax=Streptomyces sp. NPDC052396 TaxID=3365689 RepID=UPI0037CD01AA
MDLQLDRHQRDLAMALRAALAGADPDDVGSRLKDLDLYALECPVAQDGLGLGLGMGVIVAEELGRYAARDDYRHRAAERDRATVPAGRVKTRERIRQAAYLLGLATGAHRLAVQRAAQRHQFGTALAQRQAIAFPLAAQYAHQEALCLLVHRAAWLDDRNEPAGPAAARALAYAAEQALEATAWAVHVHGAFALTRHAPVHRHRELAAVEAVRLGSPSMLWRESKEASS